MKTTIIATLYLLAYFSHAQKSTFTSNGTSAQNGGYTEIYSELKPLLESADIQIVLKEIKSTDKSTISEFEIDGGKVTGYFLEPPRGTKAEEQTQGSLKRIPYGVYEVHKHNCRDGVREKCSPWEYKLKMHANPNSGSRDKILIHSGNYHNQTVGCLLPGTKFNLDFTLKLEETRFDGTIQQRQFITDVVWESKKKLKEIYDYIESKRIDDRPILVKILLR